MSHFAVLVAAHSEEEVHELLKPFEENSEENLTFIDETELVMNQWENSVVKAIKSPLGESSDNPYLLISEAREKGINTDDAIKIPLKDYYLGNFDFHIKDYYGYEVEIKDGKESYGYYSNENAKWDWYQIGGRWAGSLLVKDSVKGDIKETSWQNSGSDFKSNQSSLTQKKDIDLDLMIETGINDVKSMVKELKNSSETVFDENGKILEFNKFSFLGFSGNDYVTGKTPEEIESYLIEGVKKDFPIPCFSVLDAKNGWMENSKMGWFGMHSEEKEDKNVWENKKWGWFNSLDDDITLYIVDCHI